MKKLILILWIIVSLGILMRLVLIPGALMLIFLSDWFLALLYLFFGFAIFNDVKKVFSGAEYSVLALSNIISGIFLGLAFFLLLLGIQFRLRLVPYSGFLLLLGLCMIAIISVTMLSVKQELFKNMILSQRLHFLFGLVIGIIVLITPL